MPTYDGSETYTSKSAFFAFGTKASFYVLWSPENNPDDLIRPKRGNMSELFSRSQLIQD